MNGRKQHQRDNVDSSLDESRLLAMTYYPRPSGPGPGTDLAERYSKGRGLHKAARRARKLTSPGEWLLAGERSRSTSALEKKSPPAAHGRYAEVYMAANCRQIAPGKTQAGEGRDALGVGAGWVSDVAVTTPAGIRTS